MRTNEQRNFSRHGHPGHGRMHTIVIATIFIVVGLMFLGKNLGLVDPYLFNIVVSWQMLLIVIGISSLFNRHLIGGITLIALGTYFLLPEITGMEGEWVKTYWPVALIVIGIGLLFKRKRHRSFQYQSNSKRPECGKEEFRSEDGFVISENTFGSIQQIVLDPVFKGAQIKNTFGGTILDLRRTSLGEPQTFVDIECTFGGIEIFVPNHWNIQNQVRPFLGGCDDKRYNTSVLIDQEHVLIVKGTVTFGGVEFKS